MTKRTYSGYYEMSESVAYSREMRIQEVHASLQNSCVILGLPLVSKSSGTSICPVMKHRLAGPHAVICLQPYPTSGNSSPRVWAMRVLAC